MWGSGIAAPQPSAKSSKSVKSADSTNEDPFRDFVVTSDAPTPREWGSLTEVKRVDVEQADIAPLLAVASNLPIPANSVGRVPIEYLALDPADKAQVEMMVPPSIILEKLEWRMM